MTGIRSDVAELLHDDFEDLEGFDVVRGRLRRIEGMKPLNTTAFADRVVGVTVWKQETA